MASTIACALEHIIFVLISISVLLSNADIKRLENKVKVLENQVESLLEQRNRSR